MVAAAPRRPATIARVGARPAIVVALLIAAGIPSLLPTGSAQVPDQPDPPEISFRLDSLAMEKSPVVAQGDNRINGRIVNDGDVTVQVWAYIEAKYAGTTQQGDTRTFTIQPGDSQTVTWVWSGPSLDTTASDVVFTLYGWRQIGEQKRDEASTSITRPVQVNAFQIGQDHFWENPATGIEQGSNVKLTEFTLHNKGTATEAPSVEYAAVTVGECLDGLAAWGIDASPVLPPIPAGSSTTVSLHATAPQSGWGGCHLEMTVRVYSTEPRVQAHGPLRAERDFQTPSVTQGENLVVSISPTPPLHDDVPLGQPRTFTANVFNPTAASENLRVTAVAEASVAGAVATVNPSTPVGLGPGQDSDFTITVEVAANALAGLRTWTVEVLDDEDSVRWSHDIQLDVQSVYGADVAPADGYTPPAQSDPGDTITVQLSLGNLGNARDEICIEADLPADWTQGQNCLEIEPATTGEEEPFRNIVDFEWELTPATWALAGDRAVTFWAISSGGAESDPVDVSFTISPKTHPVLEPDLPAPLPSLQGDCVFSMDAGSMVFPLRLRNDGNTPGTFALTRQDVEAGWAVTVPLKEGGYYLERQESTEVQIQVQSPPGFDPGESAAFTLVLADESQQTSLECVVHAAFPDLVLEKREPFTATPVLYAGHPATLGFRLSNEGWTETEALVEVKSILKGPKGEEHEANHTLPALDPWTGDSREDVDVTFTPSKKGFYTYTVTVDPDDSIEEPVVSNNVLTGIVEVIDFGVRVEAPPGREAIPTQHLTFEGKVGNNPGFRVVNDSPTTHTLDLSLVMDPPWKPAIEEQVTLGPGEDHWIDVKFTVPATPLVGEAKVTLIAAKSTLLSLAPQDTTRIRIHDTEAPTVSDLEANATAVLSGGNVSFSVDLHDTTGIDEARLIVIGPDGTQTTNMTGARPVGAFHASVRFHDLGIHTAYVWAKDRSNAQNTVDTGETDTLTIRVLPTDRPHIQLVTPDNASSVRPGTPIVLSILSRLPVAELSYSLAGDAHTVPATNPVQLPTKEWSEGPANLTMIVVDSLGASGHANFTFYVDATAPTIHSISIEPEDAAPGTPAIVLAELTDASPMASVDVRLQDSNGVAKDSGMQWLGSGLWAFEGELPDDLAKIAVIAIDQAGNRAYAERSLGDPTLHGEDGSGSQGIPAPGSAWLLLGIALYASIRRSKLP